MKDKIIDFFKNVRMYMKKPEMFTLPTSLAYYFALAVVPIISITLIIATNLSIPTSYLTNFFQNNFSTEMADLLTPMVTGGGFTIGFIVYLIVAFFIVSNGANAIIVASNTIFNIKNKSFFKRRLKALLITLLLILLLIFMLVVPVFGEQLINIIKGLGFESNKVVMYIEFIYPYFNIPVSLLMVYIMIKLIYVIAPDETIKGKYVTKGAVFTTIGWVIITRLYSWYINTMSVYNLYYAGLSTIIMFMIWFYFLAFIFVLGLSMNYQTTEENIEKTNAIKLKEIENKVKASKIK